MSRRGIILPAALLVLCVLSVTAALLLSAATVRLRSGMGQLAARVAFEAAEGSVQANAAALDLAGVEALAAGGAAGLPPGVLLPGIQIEDSIYSLGGGRYLVVAVGSRRGADDRVLARARVAQLVAAAPGGEVVFVPGGWWRWGW